MRFHLLRSLAIAALVFGSLALPAAALAAPPANDAFASAKVIDPSSLPFNDAVTIDEATLEGGEPTGCYFPGKSVWYTITPTSKGILRADISNSAFFDRILNVYRQDGSGFAGLSRVACASPYYNGQSAVSFTVQAGHTYYLQAGGLYPSSTGTLNLSVQSIPAPANDDFANASSITSLPFSANPDLSGATLETGEPVPSCGYSPLGSVWYAFTPSSTGSYMVNTSSASFSPEVVVYAGGSLSTLTQTGCKFGGPFIFHADAGTTVFLQLANGSGTGGPIQFSVDVAPAPVPTFYRYPSDPSTFDTVQFIDQSYDPGGNGFSSEVWEFGDGGAASSSGCCPTHRYSTDGTYKVTLTVKTTDGRTASISQNVEVKTHDVTIAKVLVPQTAGVGQSRTITVGLTNGKYPETVQVQLLKSVAGGGWQQVGVLTQYVPVRGANRTTTFDFSYTFAPEDAVLGKISFQAIASLQGARDAIPTDNVFISLPTKVAR
jgi:PKD repeat protein